MHGFTDRVIIARRDELIKNINNNDNKERNNLINILLQSSIDGKPLSNLDIREEVDTFMFAGHDTVSSASSFTLYNLAKYPEIQKKVFEEMLQVFGDDKRRTHTLKDLNELRYLELVIKESLRIFSPVPFIGRKLKKDTLVSKFKSLIEHFLLHAISTGSNPNSFQMENCFQMVQMWW